MNRGRGRVGVEVGRGRGRVGVGIGRGRKRVGVGVGRGRGGGRVTTKAASSEATKLKKSLLQRLDADIASLVDNFSYMVNVARVQAADSLLKLVSELKQGALFSGVASLNDNVDQRIEEFNKLEESTEGTLSRIREEAAASLNELESHYYSTVQSSTPHQD